MLGRFQEQHRCWWGQSGEMRGEPQEMMEEKGRDYWGALLSLVGDWGRNLDVGSKPEGDQWWLLGWGSMCQSCIPALATAGGYIIERPGPRQGASWELLTTT